MAEDMGRSFEKGWEAGANCPIGPSVGRGLFSNPFLTERDRDLQDVRTLYECFVGPRAFSLRKRRLDRQCADTIFSDACQESSGTEFQAGNAMGIRP